MTKPDIAAFIAARLAEDQARFEWYIAESPHQGPQLIEQIGYGGEWMLCVVAALRALMDGHDGVHRCDWGEHRGGDFGPCKQALTIAAIWQDHPDHSEGWKP